MALLSLASPKLERVSMLEQNLRIEDNDIMYGNGI